LIPLAFGIMAGAGNSHRLVHRLGTTKVVMIGMLLVSAVMASFFFWDVDTPYWVLGLTVFLLALGMGNVMAPSTDAVMGAVPEEQAGVGSAMNDVVRMVGGAFGVAIIGSVINSVYSDRMTDATAGLPPQAAEPAGDSVGAALAVSAQLGGEAGTMLMTAAQSAFVDAMGFAALIAAAVAFAGALLVRRFMPPRDDEEEAHSATALTRR
jgi:hypothetical protein